MRSMDMPTKGGPRLSAADTASAVRKPTYSEEPACEYRTKTETPMSGIET